MPTLRKFIIVGSLFFFFFSSTNSFAQHYYTRNITIKDGLPSNKIQDIFKDSRGYIWIGTEAGLCRFDGVNYKVYTKRDGLAGNRIWSITEDAAGNLWVACYGNGISRFDGKTFRNFSEKDGLVNNNVRKIEYSKKHRGLMIGTVYGFSFYQNSMFTSFQDSTVTKRSLLQVTAFLETDSLIYLLTYYDNQQFIEFNPKTKRFQYLDSRHRYHYKSNISTYSFITSNKRDTLIGYSLIGMKTYTKDSIIVNTKVGQVFDIAEDKLGRLWLASWAVEGDGRKNKGGVYRLIDNREEYFNDKLGISTQQCWCLYYDKNDNMLWIGTIDCGIYLYPMTGVNSIPATEMNIKKPQINDIFIDSKKNTWLSVGDRLIKSGRETKVFSQEEFQAKYSNSIKDYSIYKLDKEGSYSKYQRLIDNGIYRYPNPYLYIKSILPKGACYKPYEYDELVSKRVTNLYKVGEDSVGNIWVGSNAGIYTIDRATNRINIFKFDEGQFNFFFESNSTLSVIAHYEMYRYTISDSRISGKQSLRKNVTWSSLVNYVKKDDIYWLYSNSDGLATYQKGKLTRFPYLDKYIDLEINALCIDSGKHLIAGTNTGKIYILSHTNDSLKVDYQLSEANGIVGSEIGWLLTDRHNRLWVATNKGLNMVNLPQLYRSGKIEVSYYNAENGLFDYTTTKALLDSTGNLLVMSRDVLFRIAPDELVKTTQRAPKLVLDRIDVNFKAFDWVRLGHVDSWSGLPDGKIELSHTDNTLTVYFHLLQYLEPSKVLYSYKLEGMQKDWSPLTAESKAVFTNLSPGNYKLVVRAKLLSNPNKISELELSFSILPPWWRTWWFYGGIIMTLLLSTYWFFTYRLRIVNEKNSIKQRISELRLEALRSQMNPHFIFNAFNSLQLYILKQETKSALDYMAKFAILIRKMLEYSSKTKIQLTEEVAFLENYLYIEQKRVSNLSFSFIIDPKIDTEAIFLPPMMIQPLIENALLHGIRHADRDGRILVEFRIENEHLLRCIVEDNGIGRAKSAEIYASQQKTHNSRSTAITTERIYLLNASCGEANISLKYTDLQENGNPTGTRVELVMVV